VAEKARRVAELHENYPGEASRQVWRCGVSAFGSSTLRMVPELAPGTSGRRNSLDMTGPASPRGVPTKGRRQATGGRTISTTSNKNGGSRRVEWGGRLEVSQYTSTKAPTPQGGRLGDKAEKGAPRRRQESMAVVPVTQYMLPSVRQGSAAQQMMVRAPGRTVLGEGGVLFGEEGSGEKSSPRATSMSSDGSAGQAAGLSFPPVVPPAQQHPIAPSPHLRAAPYLKMVESETPSYGCYARDNERGSQLGSAGPVERTRVRSRTLDAQPRFSPQTLLPAQPQLLVQQQLLQLKFSPEQSSERLVSSQVEERRPSPQTFANPQERPSDMSAPDNDGSAEDQQEGGSPSNTEPSSGLQGRRGKRHSAGPGVATCGMPGRRDRSMAQC